MRMKFLLLVLAAVFTLSAHADTWSMTSAEAKLTSTAVGGTSSLFHLLNTAGFPRSRKRDDRVQIEGKGIVVMFKHEPATHQIAYDATITLGNDSSGHLAPSPSAGKTHLVLKGEISNLLFDVVAKYGTRDAILMEPNSVKPKFVAYHFESVRCYMTSHTICVVELNNHEPH